MFLVRWAATLLSLPLVWAGQLARVLQLPLSVPLLKAAWRVGGNGPVALLALVAIRQRVSAEAARAQAARWLALRPQPEITVYAGALALEAGELDSAHDLLARAEAMEPDREGLLEMLQLGVAEKAGGPAALLELAQHLESRTDLAPAASKLVREQLLWDALAGGRWDEARRRAARLWSIEDNPLAATAQWVLARRAGRRATWYDFAGRIKLTAAQAIYFELLGFLALGAMEDARRCLDTLERMEPSLAAAALARAPSKESTV
jgi:hypothetical protein